MSEKKFQFSFNSFRYMKDLDISELQEVEKKPFRLVDIVLTLLMGAMNWNMLAPVTEKEVEAYLSEFLKEGSIGILLSDLMEALQESDFFKSLQRGQ